MPSTILSDNGVTSGTSGIKTTGSNDGQLALQTTTAGGTATTALTIDTSQNVGIGTASPTANRQLTLSGNDAGLQISGSAVGANCYLTTTPGASADFYFGTTSSKPIIFVTNGATTERMRINAGAPILCLSGGNTSATGTGIAFPATQSASSDANTLDDYEEGSWTPTFTATTAPTGVTYTTRIGRYTKIGNSVTVWGMIELSSKGSGGANEVRITDLPFTSENITGFFARGVGDIGNATWGASKTQVTFATVPNNTYVAIIESGSGQGLTNPTWANQNNDSTYYFTITYRSA